MKRMSTFEKEMVHFPEKLEGLIFRLQERRNTDLRKEELVMHWDALSNKLLAHWIKNS